MGDAGEVGVSVMGIKVILGIGNFSAIFRIRGLSNGEFWDDFLLFSVFILLLNCEKINIPTADAVMIVIIAKKITKIFHKLRGLVLEGFESVEDSEIG